MPAILLILILLVVFDIFKEEKKEDYMLSCVSETKTKEQCEKLYNEVVNKTEEEK